MKTIWLAVLVVVSACGGPLEAEPDVLAQAQAPLTTTPEAACKASADARVAAWKKAGLTNEEIERRRALVLSSCADASMDDATAMFIGAVNSDYERLARQLAARTLTPEQYLQRVWDRSRKARLSRADKMFTAAYGLGDADADLIPNAKDLCPNTPDLVPTDDRGCPVVPAKVSPAPDPELVQRVLNKLGVMASAACNAAPAPMLPAWVKVQQPPNCGGAFDLIVPKVTNQPAGCMVFYEFEAVSDDPVTAQRSFARFLFRDRDAATTALPGTALDPEEVRFRFLLPGPASGPLHTFRHDVAFQWRTVIHVRAVNGNGVSSGWTPLAPL